METRKRYNNSIRCFNYLTILVTALLFANRAYAAPLKEIVANLKPLSLRYGENNIQIGDQDILITKGEFENGNAWGGDSYTVLVKQTKGNWQFARHENGGRESILTNSQPHTEEDAIISISFMVPKDEKNSSLYLLKTNRKYKEIPSDSGPAEFTLYILQPDQNFGIFYFHKLQSEISKAKYCNADSAAYHELGIPLPGEGKEFSCAKSD